MNARLIIGTAFTRFSMLTQDSLTPLLLESGVTGEPSGDTQDVYDGRSYAKWDHASARHDGQGNVLFGDGHADPVSGLDLANKDSVAIQWDLTR